MSAYMLEIVIDGKSNKMMLEGMPEHMIVRLYDVVHTEELILLGEKVLK